MGAARGLWGVGTFRVGDEAVDFPVGTEDVARDVRSAERALGSLGVGGGSRVLVVSQLSEAAQYSPLLVALVSLGAQLSCAEATRFDAFRTEMFLRVLRYDAVVGVSADVLDGLADLGRPLAAVFAGVPVVAARAGAHGRLREAGVAARWWLHVGPTIAVECGRGAGAHVDGEEWEVEDEGGEILVSARRPRAAKVDRQRTWIPGTVLAEPCGCGRADPRIVPEEDAVPVEKGAST